MNSTLEMDDKLELLFQFEIPEEFSFFEWIEFQNFESHISTTDRTTDRLHFQTGREGNGLRRITRA
jgi:hypothetical protein